MTRIGQEKSAKSAPSRVSLITTDNLCLCHAEGSKLDFLLAL